MKKQAYRGWLSVLTLTSLALTTAAPAKTIRVRPDGKGDFPTIQAAVEGARTGDTIVLEQGVYSGSGNRDVRIEAKSLTLTSRDPNDPRIVADTILDGEGAQRLIFHYIRDAETARISLVLAGLTIRNGADKGSGGALWWEDADLEVINCTFANNRIDSWGGAVFCRNSDARFAGCTFTGNTSNIMHGGAIHVEASQADLTKCSFQGNRGPALETYDSQVTVTKCDFQGNEGRDGGAIHSRADTDPESSSLAVTGCTFSDNSASASGGALYLYGLRATVDTCTFETNTAGQDGGAVCNYRDNPTISSCLFAGNTATGSGGAVHNVYSTNSELINCTVVANKASKGGAVAGLGGTNLLVSHSILWNNTAAEGPSVYLGRLPWSTPTTATATVEYSDVEGDSDSTTAESGCNVRWGTGNFPDDPLFTAPSRGDYRLAADSPAIDAGDPSYTPEKGKTDLDGRVRLLGSAVDFGAYECPGLGPVYRFWSPTLNKHFYTMKASERDKLVTKYANVWQLEGEAYYAFYQPVDENLQPVYRFWSPKLASHFWTISEAERDNTIRNYPGVWVSEGIAFYAYPQGRQPLGTLPVYRFWSNRLGYHFYTISESEKSKLLRNYPQVWQYEGIAWYAYDKGRQPNNTAYVFTGGPDEASYILTLGTAVDGKEVSLAVPDVQLSVSSTWMQMGIDFDRSSAMLNRMHIQTAVTDYKATIPIGGSGDAISLTLSVEGLLDTSTPQGPFAIDPSTGVFSDISKPNPDVVLKDPLVRCTGSIRLGTQEQTFTVEGVANRFETEATGTFESLNLLPDQVIANIPYTFQWHRQYVKDILVDTVVGGHRVQVYATSIYVGTQGRWKGNITR